MVSFLVTFLILLLIFMVFPRVSPFHPGWIKAMIPLIGGLLAGFTFLIVQVNNNFQNFNNQFLKLLDLHKNNVNDIDISSLPDSGYPRYTKHYFFQYVLDEFMTVHNLVSINIRSRRMNEAILFDAFEREKESARKATMYLEDFTAVNISYLIVFFGMTKGKESLRSALRNTYSEELITGVFQWLEAFEVGGETPRTTPLHGFQGVLGHYFRHLFSTVKFVNTPQFVSTATKKDMIKMLRAQLSTFEQALLTINSLSVLGRKWEIESDPEHKDLITTYDLTRNIPSEFFGVIDPKKVYPFVKYES